MLFQKKLSFLEKVMVQRAHPVKWVLEVIGLIWGTYFLWHGNVALAAALGIGFSLIGTIAVWGHGEEKLAKTSLGKGMLMHANLANVFFHLVGLVVYVAGVYGHYTELILWGVTIFIFGHLWGWGRMDKNYEVE